MRVSFFLSFFLLITKKEMMNYMQFLVAKRASLQEKHFQKDKLGERYYKGKLVLSTAEFQRLDLKIRESLQLFNLYSNGDLRYMTSDKSDFNSITNNTAFELDSSDEEICEDNSSEDSDVSLTLSFNSEESDTSNELCSTTDYESINDDE